MEAFYKYVLFIFSFVFLLTVIGIIYSIKNTTQPWPPAISQCPDYWEMNIDENGKKICTNIKNLGTCTSTLKPDQKHQTMDFNLPEFTGSNGNCSKYKWAKNCNVQWDGITYGVNNPCE